MFSYIDWRQFNQKVATPWRGVWLRGFDLA